MRFGNIVKSIKDGSFIKKVNTFLSDKSPTYKKALLKYYSILPIQKNKIVFDNFGGKGFGERPAMIAIELLKTDRKLDLVWTSIQRPEDLPDGIRWVQYGSIDAFREWKTAHIWIDNIRNANHPSKRKGQYYIQTWHAAFGIKKVEQLAEQFLSPIYIEAAKRDSENTDIFLAESVAQEKLVSKYYWYNGEIMPVQFISPSGVEERSKVTEKVIEFYHIDDNASIIFYAPTFRNDSRYDYSIDYNRVIEAAHNRYGEKWVVIMRLHPNVLCPRGNEKEYNFNTLLLDGSIYPDINELILAAKIIISDYSSVVTEAIRYSINSIIYAPDYDNYSRNERGFIIDLASLPTPFTKSIDDLCFQIETFVDGTYKQDCNTFNMSVGYYDGAYNVSHLVDRIIDIVK